MAEQKTLQIGDFTYACTPIGAGPALHAAARVAALVAPVLAAGGSGDDAKARAIGALLGHPELPNHIEALAKAFGARTLVISQNADPHQPPIRTSLALEGFFDEHFAGRLGALLEWLAFALEVNLGSFFAVSPALRAKLSGVLAKHVAPSKSESPTPAK